MAHSEKAKQIFKLMYGDKAKEYSFSGSLGAEKKMWDKFFKAIDKDDLQTAANVMRTLEEENWHTMTDAMEQEMDKPANERKGYFDRAEEWNNDRESRNELRKMAHKYGTKTASEREEETRRRTSPPLSGQARAAFNSSFSRKFTQEQKDRFSKASKAGSVC